MTTTTARTGLSTTDVDEIRRQLDAGRRPKVVFTAQAGQIAGQTGQVVRLDDPRQGEEWVVVRFGKDELPFSPADLTVPSRGRPPAPKPARVARSDRSGGAVAAVPTPRPEQPAAAPAPDASANGAAGASAPAGGAAAKPAKATGARAGGRAARGRSRPPAAMTVTLAYQEGEWTVAAHQGSKVLAKPYLVRPAEALKMVAMLDVPGVHEAVDQIVSAELAEAQQRAETLRSELAEVESRLAELRGAAS